MDERLAYLRQALASDSALPIETTFEHRAPTAKGEVELQYWPARDGVAKPPVHLTLFILGQPDANLIPCTDDRPGNPGLVNYYIPFLTHLHSLLPPDHAILSTSHIGHAPDLPIPVEPLDLLAHLAAKLELVKALRVSLDAWGNEPRAKLALMGHSVGSWLLCEVMKREEEGAIEAGYMLFPTIGWIADTRNGRTLWVGLCISLLLKLTWIRTADIPSTP